MTLADEERRLAPERASVPALTVVAPECVAEPESVRVAEPFLVRAPEPVIVPPKEPEEVWLSVKV